MVKPGEGRSAAWFDLVCNKSVRQIRTRSGYHIGTASFYNQLSSLGRFLCESFAELDEVQ